MSEAPQARGVLSRAQAGEAEAFRVIFDRHAPAVRRFLGDVLRDEAAADEATQETFVRAHARLSTLHDETKLLAWLVGIARFVFLEQVRRPKGAELAGDDGPSPAEVDRAPTPEAALLSREADSVLDSALGTLSAERRAALVLRLDQGLGYGEIAQAMGWPLQKVKNEIHRARLQLRERLAAYLEGKPCT